MFYKATNYEVRFIYAHSVLDWVAAKLPTGIAGYYTFGSLWAAGEVEAFEELLRATL